MASSTSDHIRKVAANALFIGAVKDEWQMFSDNFSDYVIGAPIGSGASSIVYAAQYHPRDGSPGSPCALKVLDLDKLPQQSLRLLRRETQLMSLSKHPNVLRVRGSWMVGHKLYIALRLMNSGSAADVMRYGWPGGLEEEVVKCILKQALEGLNYLHVNGFIHRDIKAANLLIDDDGTVLLGDLGVSASLCDDEAAPVPSGSRPNVYFESGTDSKRMAAPLAKRLGKRKSFVGTPCWMAPELISGKQYDSKADIWSFGITAIELCQGRAPRSRETAAKVLLKTVQDDPPAFSREGGQYKYSKSFKDMVDRCLVKDPTLRPTAAELLEMPFFKSAKRKNYLVGAILKDLPPLTKRQERRFQSSMRTVTTIGSWDFSSNPVTPITTIARRPHSFIPGIEEAENSDDANSDVEGESKDRARPSPLSQSPESSMADLSSSNPTTPEVVSSSLPSAASTPLSCSPSTSARGDSNEPRRLPARLETAHAAAPVILASSPAPQTLDHAPSPKKSGIWKKLVGKAVDDKASISKKFGTQPLIRR